MTLKATSMLQEYLSALVVIGLSAFVLGNEEMQTMGAMDTEAMYKAPEAPRYEAAKAAAALGDNLDQVMFAEGDDECEGQGQSKQKTTLSHSSLQTAMLLLGRHLAVLDRRARKVCPTSAAFPATLLFPHWSS